MNQTYPLPKAYRLRPSLLWLGVCLGSLGMLTAPGFAQTTPVDPALTVPSAQDLLLPSEPAPEPPAVDTFEPAPESVLSEPSIEAPANEAPAKSVDLELSSPGANAADDATGSTAPLIAPDLAEQVQSTFGQQNSFGNFIDSTPYSLGATDNPNVVLSERSTGCETMVQLGEGVGSICSAGLAESGGYSGGISAASFGEGSLSVVYGGRVTPSGKDFYNLTIRPPAMLSAGNIGLLFPLSIPAAITSAFGWRIHPVIGQGRFHSGTDLGAPQGTPVMAAFSGKVAVADFMGGYGLAVVLQHQNGAEETLYGHLSEIFVKPGETVKQGEVIGRVGSTGLSTGPHLHFEFRKQTSSGWVVMDAGGALEFALSQFVNALKLGLSYPPKLATIRSASFTKALEMVQKPLASDLTSNLEVNSASGLASDSPSNQGQSSVQQQD